MLKRVDRIQMAAPKAEALVGALVKLYGAEPGDEDTINCWGARRVRVRLGTSWVEVLEPAGEGPVKDYIDQWRGGLFAAGFSTDRFEDVCRLAGEAGLTLTREGDQAFIEPGAIGGLRTVLSPMPADEGESAGLLKRIYEVTNPVKDFEGAADLYTRAFGIDRAGWREISSNLYGYTGALTLFEPPDRLDRIELVQITDYEKAMGRFHGKRGDSFYMCFAEVDDFDALKARLDGAGARYAVREKEDGDPNVLFVHPASLGGMLMGISKTGVAWEWSSGGEPWS